MKVWVYRSREGNTAVFEGTAGGFNRARDMQDEDNRVTVEDIEDNPDLYGNPEIGGSREEGNFYIDDGGYIELLEVQ